VRQQTLTVVPALLELLGLGGVNVEDLLQARLADTIIRQLQSLLVLFDTSKDGSNSHTFGTNLVTSLAVLAFAKYRLRERFLDILLENAHHPKKLRATRVNDQCTHRKKTIHSEDPISTLYLYVLADEVFAKFSL
jgi:hypothetical protein